MFPGKFVKQALIFKICHISKSSQSLQLRYRMIFHPGYFQLNKKYCYCILITYRTLYRTLQHLSNLTSKFNFFTPSHIYLLYVSVVLAVHPLQDSFTEQLQFAARQSRDRAKKTHCNGHGKQVHVDKPFTLDIS